jgi:hypothetical protein
MDKDPAKRAGVRTVMHKIAFEDGIHMTRYGQSCCIISYSIATTFVHMRLYKLSVAGIFCHTLQSRDPKNPNPEYNTGFTKVSNQF